METLGTEQAETLVAFQSAETLDTEEAFRTVRCTLAASTVQVVVVVVDRAQEAVEGTADTQQGTVVPVLDTLESL